MTKIQYKRSHHSLEEIKAISNTLLQIGEHKPHHKSGLVMGPKEDQLRRLHLNSQWHSNQTSKNRYNNVQKF